MKIKKIKKYTVCFFIFLCLFSLDVKAEEYKNNDVIDLKKYVPEDVLELAGKDIFDTFSGENPSVQAREINKNFGVGFIADAVLKALKIEIPGIVSSFSVVLGILIISSVLGIIKSNIKSEAVGSAFELCSELCVAAAVFESQRAVLYSVKDYLSELSIFIGGMTPVMGGIYASGGSVSSASVSSTGMFLYLSVCDNICSYVLLPVVRICYGLALAGIIAGNVNIGGVSKLIKKTVILSLTFVSVLLSTVMAYQSVIAASVDSAASKIVKFSIGSFVPIVGGAAGDTVKNLSASMSLMKNTIGVFGIIVILLMVIPVLVNLFAGKFMLGISTVAADILDCKKESKLFSELGELNNVVIGITVICTLLFIFAFTVFIKTTLAVGA